MATETTTTDPTATGRATETTAESTTTDRTDTTTDTRADTTTDTTTGSMTYDEALGVFLATKGSYGGGLSNHGPMAAEALVDMGAGRWIGPFVTAYRPRLDPRTAPSLEPDDWRSILRAELPARCGAVAAEAGHGLLRVAHAVRGIERAERAGEPVPPVRVAELRAAIGYWRAGGAGIPGPDAVDGSRSVTEWASALEPLSSFDPLPGMLTGTFDLAARRPGFVAAVASLDTGGDDAEAIDRLALLATAGYLRNEQFLSRFALLHGVTVSTMSRILLPHVDGADRRRLVASVAGFVAAALVGFDRPSPAPAPPPPIAGDLGNRAGATLDDHTIKFSDACLGLAARTGDDLPLRAAELQVALTS